MSLSLPRRKLRLAVLRARDPCALSYGQAYELYRADFARDLRAAERAFHAESGAPADPVLLWLCDGLLLAATFTALAFDAPLPGLRPGLPLILAAAVFAGAWAARRRLGGRRR